jgi:hypothetical protein
MVARRLLLLLAFLMLLTALAAQVAPPPESVDGPATPTPTTERPRPAAEEPGLVQRTIRTGGAGVTIVEAQVANTIRLVVEGDALATVELKGLDQIEVVTPDSPAIFEVYADREGTFPVVVLESEREIARLEVSR